MTALRTVGGDAAAAERAKVKAELVADAVAQLKAHIEADAPTQQALFGRLMSKALDDFAERTQALRRGEFWRGATMFLFIGLAVGIFATRFIYDSSLTQGAVLGRGEALNTELKQMEDAR